MLSSGTTAIATSSAAAVTLIANGNGEVLREVNVINTGTAAGFVSIDNGHTWCYMPAGSAGSPSSRTFDIRHRPFAVVVQAQRIGATDMTGLFADAY
jgi:hypothetical protein